MSTERNWFYASEWLEKTPKEIEGWESMYPYYYVMRKEYAKELDKPFWFQDQMHVPTPLAPFEGLSTCEGWNVYFSAVTERLLRFPMAHGNNYKIFWGYIYNGSLYITDPQEQAERAKIFQPRLEYILKNWDDLYAKWEEETKKTIAEIEKLNFEDLPDAEPDELFPFESSAFNFLDSYNRLLSLWYKIWRLHFYPLLNLAYMAQLVFYDFMKTKFPDIKDETIVRLLRGLEPLLFRAGIELERLTYLARDLGVTDVLKKEVEPEQIIEELKQTDAGRKWVEEYEKIKYPWFYTNTAPHPGLYATWRYPSWIHDLSIPFSLLKANIVKLEKGEKVERPIKELDQDREQLVAEYRALLPTDEDRAEFDGRHAVARRAFITFTENHVWYVECWAIGLLYEKIRQIAEILAKHGFFKDWKDVIYLNRFELAEAIYDLCIHWAEGAKPVGPDYWPPIIEKRRQIWENMNKVTPPLIMGQPPEKVADPIWLMLWGITDDRVAEWTGAAVAPTEVKELRGHAGSPGLVTGPAKVISSPTELNRVELGDILVCGATSPAWVAVFPKLIGVVTDGGGIMCHSAIVAREYGVPAVVGTGHATKVIKTGQKLEVDGSNGLVRILD